MRMSIGALRRKSKHKHSKHIWNILKVCQYPGDLILYMEDKQTVHLTKKIMKCLKIYLVCGYQILGMQILFFFKTHHIQIGFLWRKPVFKYEFLFYLPLVLLMDVCYPLINLHMNPIFNCYCAESTSDCVLYSLEYYYQSPRCQKFV